VGWHDAIGTNTPRYPRQCAQSDLALKVPGAFVFHRNGKPLRDFRTTWDKAAEAAGLTGLKFHDLRRRTTPSSLIGAEPSQPTP